ncbi:MATE family efflux transporter [Chitinivorax sp. B]|uniref:MATE family efflux transporter n=1 Tax=Chitinivorax sp. B TaxID=2502235 RepID=UPI0010F7A76B|nr:MATE family efflux transporter [Chitinivorax sp. B]
MTHSHNQSQVAPPSLIALAWPIFVEQALHLTVGMVDTFMVSHISDHAVAALGSANQFVAFFLVLFGFVSMGCSVVVTHHLGARDKEGAERVAATAISVNTWLGLLISIGVYCLAEPLLRLVQLSDTLLQYAVPFLSLMGGTLFLESINLAISAVLRAHGHTRDAMVVTLGQNVVNVIGNMILLFGLLGAPKMGVVGVALSTVISRLLACLALWVLLEYRTHLKLKASDFFQVNRERLGRILHIGLPAAGENICWWMAFMTVTAFTARMGEQALATQTYTMQLVWLVVLATVAIGLATEILIGRLVGAGLFDEAYRQLLRSLRVGFAISIGVVIVVAIASPWILHLFTDDPVVIATGAMLMRIGLILEPGRVFNIVVISSLRAAGDARYPALIGMVSMWGVMVFGAWLFGTYLGFGLIGVWVAMILDEWLRGMLMYRRWKQKKWMKYARRTHANVQIGATA